MNPSEGPSKLGKYTLIRVLGRGGMGVVYEGFDPEIQRRVAIKAIRRDLIDDPLTEATTQRTGGLLDRLRREAQAGGRLNHPRIVTVHDYGEDISFLSDGWEVRTPYIVMEFIEGRELRSHLGGKGRLPFTQMHRIMDELLDGLGYAHAQGVIHRDIKPANVMILRDGSIKIMDFGIARVATLETMTVHGSIFGTLEYMAPEQLLGEPVDSRCDLYAVGVILYELLTGERPFTGASVAAITARTLRDQPLPPSTLSVSLPQAYDAVLARALAKRPDDRFQSAEEFRRALSTLTPAAGRPSSGPSYDPNATVLREDIAFTKVVSPPGNQARNVAIVLGLLIALGAVLYTVTPRFFSSPLQHVTFEQSETRIADTAGTVKVVVRRDGDLDEEERVEYLATDGTAKAGEDYQGARGTIIFGRGQEERELSIPLVQDKSYQKPDRSFTVTLVNVAGHPQHVVLIQQPQKDESSHQQALSLVHAASVVAMDVAAGVAKQEIFSQLLQSYRGDEVTRRQFQGKLAVIEENLKSATGRYAQMLTDLKALQPRVVMAALDEVISQQRKDGFQQQSLATTLMKRQLQELLKTNQPDIDRWSRELGTVVPREVPDPGRTV